MALLIASPWADGVAATRIDATDATDAMGTQAFRLRHDELDRSYLVHVPRSYDASRPTPIVLAFHGGGGDMHLQAGPQYGIVDKAEQAGFIAVFPNGYSALPSGKFATWNAGNCCAGARDRGVDDVGFVRAMLTEIKQRLSVDTERIFAVGMSNGAMMSHRLACEMSDSIRAIAAVAGTDNTRRCEPTHPVAVLVIHAFDDGHVLFGGGAGPDAVRERSRITEYTSVPETVARWVHRNRCRAASVRETDRKGAYCQTYADCAAGALVQLCVSETGGHSWPGALRVRRGQEPASQALSANDQMWEFFQRLAPR